MYGKKKKFELCSSFKTIPSLFKINVDLNKNVEDKETGKGDDTKFIIFHPTNHGYIVPSHLKYFHYYSPNFKFIIYFLVQFTYTLYFFNLEN